MKFKSIFIFGGICAGYVISPWALAQESITVVSWGGSTTASEKAAIYEPFTKKTGIEVKAQDYNGGLSEIRSQVMSGNVVWDVVIGETFTAQRGCDEGLLSPIKVSDMPLAADGSKAEDDFIPGTSVDCGIGSRTVGNVLAYNESSAAKAPHTLKDFFDLSNFPGKRGLSKRVTIVLPWALYADGVPADKVFEVLGTPEGVDRAFKKLDTIKGSIVWWEAGAQPLQLLASNEVVMTQAYSGRIFAAAVKGSPFKVVWDGQVWETDTWMIPKGSKKSKAAMEFIKFASKPEVQANMVTLSLYGVARKSATGLLGKIPGSEISVAEVMPSNPENMKSAIRNDEAFWIENQDSLEQRFNQWLLK